MLRKPNYKNRIKGRTTSRVKRKIKGTMNPLYNKRNKRIITQPSEYIKDKVYHSTTYKIDTDMGGTIIVLLYIGCYILGIIKLLGLK